MDKDADFDINQLADPSKGEESNLEKNHADNGKDDTPAFLNRPERSLLLEASAVVFAISICSADSTHVTATRDFERRRFL